MKVLDKASDDVLLGDWQSTAGTAYREVWSKLRREVDPGEPLMGIDVSDPRSNFIIYSSTRGHREEVIWLLFVKTKKASLIIYAPPITMYMK